MSVLLFSCNLQKSQVPPGPPAPPAPGSSAVWNNESRKDTANAASTSIKDARDFKRVHFNLETLNTRRLLARIASTDTKVGGAKSEGPAKPLPSKSRLCENGGPPASFASLVLSLPSASPSTSSSTQPHSAAPPPAAVAPTPVVMDPPKPGELQELQEEIEQMREKLRTALARRAQIQTTLAKPIATVTETPTQVSAATTTATDAPPIIAPVLPLPANTKCVMTMTDPPHKVLSKVRPLQSRLANQRRWCCWHRSHDPLNTVAMFLCKTWQ